MKVLAPAVSLFFLMSVITQLDASEPAFYLFLAITTGWVLLSIQNVLEWSGCASEL